MESNRQAVSGLEGLENIIWYGKRKDRKDRHTQWMAPDFYSLWEEGLKEAFDIAGVPIQFSRMHRDSDVGGDCPRGLADLGPVKGYTNGQFLRDTLIIDGCSFGHLKSVTLSDGVAVYCVGSREEGLRDWKMTLVATELGTIKYWSSRELTAYVQGLRPGYPLDISHLYRRGNKVEVPVDGRLGWAVVVEGKSFSIEVDWDEVVATYRSTGQSVIDVVERQIDSHVRAMTWKVQ